LRSDQLRRGRVRIFADGPSAKKEIYQVGNLQQPRRVGDAGLRVRSQLKQSIHFQQLNAGVLVNLCARHNFKDLFDASLRPAIAVTNRLLNQVSRRINQSVIDAPAINTDTPDWSAKSTRPFTRVPHADLYLSEDRGEVPTQMPTILRGRIMKPSHLLEQQFSRRCARQKHAPASRSEINCDVKRICHCRLSVVSCQLFDVTGSATPMRGNFLEDRMRLRLTNASSYWLCHSDLRQVSDLPGMNPSSSQGLRPG
jgi:hypothetical protein